MEMILILGFGALLIFFMMNSRKKQRQQQEKLSSGLVIGARVMTTFGVFGTVIDVIEEENKVTIESGPGSVLTIHRQAIGQIEEPVGAADLDEADGGDADRLDDDLRSTEVPDDLSSLTTEDSASDGEADAPALDRDAVTDPDSDATDSADFDTEHTGPVAADTDEAAGDAAESDGTDSDGTDSDGSDSDSSDDDRR